MLMEQIPMKKRDLLSLNNLSSKEILELIAKARVLKKTKSISSKLKGKTLAMLFEKSSTRTRVSFDVAMVQLGGHSLELNFQNSQLGRGETIADTARVLSRYVQVIMFRANHQSDIETIAKYATVPVINGLSDLGHPVQVLTDLMTIDENKINLKKMKVCFLGDYNNMVRSWIEAAQLLGFSLCIGAPRELWPDEAIIKKLCGNHKIIFTEDPIAAVKDCDVINTDTWVSMGDDTTKNLAPFRAFQVNSSLLKFAKPKAIVLHCLPAHRGEEITDAVMDGSQSRVFNQAENRLHLQKALLLKLLK